MAELLGLDELRANALTTIGFTRFTTGDLGGLEDAEQSIEVARAIKSPDIVRSLGNYASCLKDLGEIERAEKIVEEARQEAVRLGRSIYMSWLDGERLIYHCYAEALGRLDGAGRTDDRRRRDERLTKLHGARHPCFSCADPARAGRAGKRP